jgi:hypothetical protein
MPVPMSHIGSGESPGTGLNVPPFLWSPAMFSAFQAAYASHMSSVSPSNLQYPSSVPDASLSPTPTPAHTSHLPPYVDNTTPTMGKGQNRRKSSRIATAPKDPKGKGKGRVVDKGSAPSPRKRTRNSLDDGLPLSSPLATEALSSHSPVPAASMINIDNPHGESSATASSTGVVVVDEFEDDQFVTLRGPEDDKVSDSTLKSSSPSPSVRP